MTVFGLRAARDAPPHAGMRVALVLALLLAQACVGLAVTRLPPALVLTATAALAGGAALAVWPRATPILLVFFTSTIFTTEYAPRLVLADSRFFHVWELMLGGYLGTRALRVLLLRDRAFRIGGAELALGAFLAWAMLTPLLSAALGAEPFAVAFGYSRRLLPHAAFFVFAGTILSRRDVRRTLSWLQVFAAFTSLLTIAQVFAGWDRPLFFGNPIEYIQGDGTQYLRVRPPGFYLTFPLFVLTFADALAAHGRRRLLLALVLALYLSAILISLQRVVWLAIIAGAVLYCALTGPELRARAVAASVLAAGAAVLLGVLASLSLPLFRDMLFERVEMTGTARDQNTMRKFVEFRAALRKGMEQPLFGSGPGASIGLTARGVEAGLFERDVQRYSHNSYINFFVYYGLIGVTLFGLYLWLPIHQGIRGLRRTRDPATRNLLAGTLAAVAVILVSAQAMTLFETTATMPVLAFLLHAARFIPAEEQAATAA